MIRTTFARFLMPVVASSMLMACGDGGITEIHDWMEQVKRETKVSITEIPPPKKFSPFTYEAKDDVDPFNSSKLAVALAKMQAAKGNGLKPDLDRRREPLESYPLDSLKMVGTLQKPGMTYGLVQIDKVVFQVKIGNYMGQNFGLVTNITEDAIDLKEVVQDAAGEWVERMAKLELQQESKK